MRPPVNSFPPTSRPSSASDDPPPVVLVTGSARRVGNAIAHHLAEIGWTVLVHARTAATARDAAARLPRPANQPHAGFGADLRNAEELGQLGAWACDPQHGPLTALVNNASSFTKGPPEATSLDVLSEAFEVNTYAPLVLASACLSTLRAHQGIVVNLGDRGPREIWPGRTAHAASKAALATISACCDAAWQPDVAVEHLELGLVLPPDDAPPRVLALRDVDGMGWSGAQPVAEHIGALLTARLCR